jgi:hypothetical protein
MLELGRFKLEVCVGLQLQHKGLQLQHEGLYKLQVQIPQLQHGFSQPFHELSG